MICTFFGHRDTPESVAERLNEVLIDLIENKNVDLFYVGNQGNFDLLVINNLKRLKCKYPHIRYSVALAYLTKNNEYTNSIYPEGLEYAPPKYAIDRRNRWMIERADYVVTYVKCGFGGAAKFKLLAENKGKFVINLAEK